MKIVTQPRIRYLLLLIGGIALANGIMQIAQVIPWIARGTSNGDIQYYFVVGRAILNGLMPYTDIFETKPPGIFLLTALSLKLTGDERLISTLSIFILLCVALAPALYVWVMTKKEDRICQLPLFLVSLAGGILLTLYLQRWGGMNTEQFAALPALLYVWTLFLPGKRPALTFAIRVVCLLTTIGLKEPFLFVTCASALLVLRNLRAWFNAFVLPLMAAAIAGVIIMFLLGYLGSYLTTYLPMILGYRLSHDPLFPTWIIFMDMRPLFTNLQFQSSWAPLLALLILVLFCLTPWYGNARHSTRDAGWSVLTGALVLIGFSVLAFDINLLYIVFITHQIDAIGVYSVRLILSCLLLLFLIFTLRSQTARQIFPGMLLSFATLGILNYPIAADLYHGNLFSSAVPFYAALFLLFLRFAIHHIQHGVVTGVSLLTILALLFSRFPPRTGDPSAVVAESRAPEIAQADAIMDACNIDRFYSWDGPGPFSYSSHAFWGPLPYFEAYLPHLPANHPLMLDTYNNIANKNKLFIVPTSSKIPPHVAQILQAVYTQNAPPCAEPFLPLNGYDVWFQS